MESTTETPRQASDIRLVYATAATARQAGMGMDDFVDHEFISYLVDECVHQIIRYGRLPDRDEWRALRRLARAAVDELASRVEREE